MGDGGLCRPIQAIQTLKLRWQFTLGSRNPGDGGEARYERTFIPLKYGDQVQLVSMDGMPLIIRYDIQFIMSKLLQHADYLLSSISLTLHRVNFPRHPGLAKVLRRCSTAA